MALEVLGDREPLHDPARTREEAEQVGAHGHLVDGGADRLARLAGLEAPELVRVRVEDVGDLEQRQAAGLGRGEAPRLEGVLGRVDGAIDVHLARGRDVGDDGPVGRVLDRQRLAGRGVDPLAADELLVGLGSIEGLGHGGLHGHAAGDSDRRTGCVRRLCATAPAPFQRGPRRATRPQGCKTGVRRLGPRPPRSAPDVGFTGGMTATGTLLADRYRLLERIGAGGMATVWRAHDVRLGRDVAVKILRPQLADDHDFVARFEVEARHAASISNPNVATVFDTGGEGEERFIVMELVDGASVADVLRAARRDATGPGRRGRRGRRTRARRCPPARAHPPRRQAGQHPARAGRSRPARRLRHRSRPRRRRASRRPARSSAPSRYLSPEQARGEEASAAGDVFSLGVVLYEMLTGRLPWAADVPAAVATVRLTEPPVPLDEARPDVPGGLQRIVSRALSLDPSARYPSARAFAESLEAWAAQHAATLPEEPDLAETARLAAAAPFAGAAGSDDVLVAELPEGQTLAGVALARANPGVWRRQRASLPPPPPPTRLPTPPPVFRRRPGGACPPGSRACPSSFTLAIARLPGDGHRLRGPRAGPRPRRHPARQRGLGSCRRTRAGRDGSAWRGRRHRRPSSSDADPRTVAGSLAVPGADGRAFDHTDGRAERVERAAHPAAAPPGDDADRRRIADASTHGPTDGRCSGGGSGTVLSGRRGARLGDRGGPVVPVDAAAVPAATVADRPFQADNADRDAAHRAPVRGCQRGHRHGCSVS